MERLSGNLLVLEIGFSNKQNWVVFSYELRLHSLYKRTMPYNCHIECLKGNFFSLIDMH